MNTLSVKNIDGTEELAFNDNSEIIGSGTARFLELVYPSYLVDQNNVDTHLDQDSVLKFESMTFFRIGSCTVDNADRMYEVMSEKFEKLFTALHSIDVPIAYGLVSRNGVTNLVFGVHSSGNTESVKMIMQGMLSGLDMNEIDLDFSPVTGQKMNHGILSGVPSLYVKEQKQNFSLASIMRSLNGQNYTLLFIAKSINKDIVSKTISDLIEVRDQAFAVSKQHIAQSSNESHSTSENISFSNTQSNPVGQAATAIGAILGSVVGGGIGGVIGGTLGMLVGNVTGKGGTNTHSVSKSVSDAITKGNTISREIQNGFALELMNYVDYAINRLKAGQNNGVWETAIAYSAETDIARNIIRACLSGELSKLDAEKLPMVAFEPKVSSEVLPIPDFLGKSTQNPLCTYINSAELGLLCTVPTESVPDFEVRIEKQFPLVTNQTSEGECLIGNVVDGRRTLTNMTFGLSEDDLNKHTFVCGMTGSGKTTTVKRILAEVKKPFLVIESVKKEYRNIAIGTEVYTPGKPDIRAPQMNPFYIMPGIHPQMHIDYLKDLFNASFSFYGPMPYILETCIHKVYINKGWDLTLGYHPLLNKIDSKTDFFNLEYIKQQYSNISHKFLFPTMQELKDEINRYIEEELQYDGEVANNVKTAIKVRLENLCLGTKGYTFNTNECIDFDELLKKNVVFELEGLADDSDKAFCVGLLVVFINEYRHIQKEISGSQKTGLQHLLVIEEAHRLLKNIETEKTSEMAGNAKGKAVEHFTNMIAEMRSYGQGVIVAEQIPTKLAPDVIKNSSTKIVQRIVSVEDQQTMANTIGITGDTMIQLGALQSGNAYCHKEGMALPIPVKIIDSYTTDSGKQKLNLVVTDELIYNQTNRFKEINLSIIRNLLGGNERIKQNAIALLNTLMVENEDICVSACDTFVDLVEGEIKRNGMRLVLTNNRTKLYVTFLTEVILTMMVRGVYCSKILPSDSFIELLQSTLYAPSAEKIKHIKEELKQLYSKALAAYAKVNIKALINRSKSETTDVHGTVASYFINASVDTVSEIVLSLEGGV